MAEAIQNGEVEGIDPRANLRNPKPPKEIAKELHKLLIGKEEITFVETSPEIQQLYYEIIKTVSKGLDY